MVVPRIGYVTEQLASSTPSIVATKYPQALAPQVKLPLVEHLVSYVNQALSRAGWTDIWGNQKE